MEDHADAIVTLALSTAGAVLALRASASRLGLRVDGPGAVLALALLSALALSGALLPAASWPDRAQAALAAALAALGGYGGLDRLARARGPVTTAPSSPKDVTASFERAVVDEAWTKVTGPERSGPPTRREPDKLA